MVDEGWELLKSDYAKKEDALTAWQHDPVNQDLQEEYLKRLHVFIGAVTMFGRMTNHKAHYLSNLLRTGAVVIP